MYNGVYHGRQCHNKDLDVVLERAWAKGMDKMIVTAGSLAEVGKAIELCQCDGTKEIDTSTVEGPSRAFSLVHPAADHLCLGRFAHGNDDCADRLYTTSGVHPTRCNVRMTL